MTDYMTQWGIYLNRGRGQVWLVVHFVYIPSDQSLMTTVSQQWAREHLDLGATEKGGLL